MITELFLKNFKSIKTLQMPIKPITILVGENSSGKSSVLQLLALLNQSYESTTQFPIGNENNLSLGYLPEVITKNENVLTFAFTFDPRFTTELTKIRWKLSYPKDRPYTEIIDIKIQIGDTYLRNKQEKNSVTGQLKETDYFNNRQALANDPVLRNISLFGWTLHSGDLNFTEKIKNLSNFMKDFFKRITYIPPFRGIRSRGYSLQNQMPYNLSSKECEGFQANIVNILNKMFASSREKIDRLNNVLQETLEIGIESITPETRQVYSDANNIPKPITSILVKDNLTGVYSDIVNTGFGTNQVISMGIAMIYQNPSLILIEEPEIHLHPKMQAKIFDFINKLRGNKKVIITTHSDHFLSKVLQRVKEKKVNHKDVALYYFEHTKDGSKISERKMDEEGRIEGGMPGFFEHSLDELQEFIRIQKQS